MSKPAKKLAKKRVAKASLPRTLAAQPQSPTNATSSKDGKSGLEKISKQARVIDLLRSPNGTSITSVMKLTGWQQHSVRGFLAGVVKKRLGLKVTSEAKNGVRLYRLLADQTENSSPSKRMRVR